MCIITKASLTAGFVAPCGRAECYVPSEIGKAASDVQQPFACLVTYTHYAQLSIVLMFCCCAACEQVLTLKLDIKYWPSWELRRDTVTATWQRHLINSADASSAQQQYQP